ncbi:MAG: flavodoxin family protein [Candidatus Latescibacteria bacterium]|nr:flavodoxin family protein [Candidatus Latescibacterota bacterium]
MSKLLAVLCTRRRHGNTATLLKEAMAGAQTVEGVEVEPLYLHSSSFGPCRSSFWCIRHGGVGCCLDDDFGRKGEGEIFKQVTQANGIIVADPVQFWGPSATAHLFFERLYPFHWSDLLNGIPFGSITCATNQGFQLYSTREICKWAFTMKMRYIESVSAHTAQWEQHIQAARELGVAVARASLDDARQRVKFTEQDVYAYYLDKPWRVYEPYFENMTDGKYTYEDSLIGRALAEGSFKRPEAIDLLQKAGTEFKQALASYLEHNQEAASQHLIKAADFWTNATWKEFLEETVIKAPQPEAYRSLKQYEHEESPDV